MIFAFTLPIISYSQITKAEIVATGLTCSMCSNAINKQLKVMPQVDNVATNLDTNTFTVILKKDSEITPQQLKQCVEKAGFFVGSMIITMTLDNPKLDSQASLNQGESTYVFLDSEAKKITEEVKAKVLDEGFVTKKEYKKLLKSFSQYNTYAAGNKDTYHLQLI
ncbi:MAG: heavy-metal-associated domain-containing protein [Flavobacterium sp.]|nr:heavy-metal-associated domain-containing protein [Flavobacterium sp.]